MPDGTKIAFTVHNIINFMMATDAPFCDQTPTNLQNLMRGSTLISHVSKVERARFFRQLRSRIAAHMQGKNV